MKTLTVRNISDRTYEKLKALAKENHRSLQEQARYVLDNEVNLHEHAVMERAAEYRTRLGRRTLGNTVRDIREDRER